MNWREHETVEQRATADLGWVNKRIEVLKGCHYPSDDLNKIQAQRSLENLDLARQILAAVVGRT